MPEEKDKKSEDLEQYEVTFRNGALVNLKKLARDLDVPESDLREVVNKSINLLTLAKNANIVVIENQKGDRYRIDLKKL